MVNDSLVFSMSVPRAHNFFRATYRSVNFFASSSRAAPIELCQPQKIGKREEYRR